MSLSDRGIVSAVTTSGSGSNINLNVDKRINLSNNSLISAQAFNQADGGNINIDTSFIVVFPNQLAGNGNDIIASAAGGNGGEITIDADSLLGILERSAIANNNSDDIDASSEFGLDGTVSIFTPQSNTLESISELPQNVVEAEQTTAQVCSNNQDNVGLNTLTISGRGGIQTRPEMPLKSDFLLNTEDQTSSSTPIPQSIKPISTAQGEIIIARGVEVRPNGDIYLTPYATKHVSSNRDRSFSNCK